MASKPSLGRSPSLRNISYLWGGGKLKEKIRKKVYTWDIMPTILHSLDLPIPEYVDGKVILNAFKDNSILKNKKIKYTSREVLKYKIRRFKYKK